MNAVHSFIVDGDEPAFGIGTCIDKAIRELHEKSHLTITVNDVTIERNPHGDGMWNYVLKVNSHE